MSYNSSIPIVGDYMQQSQPQLLANFQAISTVFAQNHQPLTLPSDNSKLGMHNLLLFREQNSDPVTSATQICLYTKAVNSIPNLFYMPNSSQTPIQLTYPSLTTGIQSLKPTVYFQRQQTFLAGPFVLYTGVILGAVSGQLITLLPSSTLLCVSLIQLGSLDNQKRGNFATVCATGITANQFTIQFQTGLSPQTVYYTAIGQ